ncbi:metal ABC transporter permease [Corynebacterium otitidis]|uniref:Manganese transport system membrane protein n=1 Tax=Corynebacterium otitidis ATCC 51513 TaxID=883169 RepID=I7IXG2_9CORY|nr:metal ABC transporter permease [Corynebacterium otitidis]EJZ81792.1 hypothetical protein HMPREF9719_01309 [Corynebacterium otitidis ATCC 51513]KKO84249.1 helicase [Corynebacterium otitidis]CCI83793.1 Manganese transport system membrane protein [Corynebacterium otitidis ATCC 51513]
MSWWDSFVEDTAYLLGVGFVQDMLVACALLGVLSGVMAPLIVLRRMSFTVHATSELALMGASGALLFGIGVEFGAVAGAIAAAVLLAVLGLREQQDSAIGAVMSFGLGLSVLFLYLYPGNPRAALSLLTGRIVGVSEGSVAMLAVITALVVGLVLVFWRPLLFSSVDPDMAAAAGVPVKVLSVGFAMLVGLTAAQSLQIVGALLVLALLITPGAAAVQITASPVAAVGWSVLFAEVSAVVGMVLSLAPGLPVSVFVTTTSFVIYLVCRLIGWWTGRSLKAAQRAAREDAHHSAATA